MTNKFKNKYKINSARLKNYDYSQNGVYFVTICTKNKEDYFGEIENEKINLNEAGKIANKYWLEIPNHFPSVRLGEFIVMPNHLHGIIEIFNDIDEAVPRLYTGQHPLMSRISPKAKSLSVVIGSFKSIVSKTINKQLPNLKFFWQPRFYEHIIRKDESLNKIREYIKINPREWKKDKNNLENIFM